MTSDASLGTADDMAAAKHLLRQQIVDARAARPVAQRLDDDRARTGLVLAALRGIEPATIAIYLSTSPHSARPEPGTIELATALWTLGHRLLCPVLTPTDDGPRHDPAWAVFEGPGELRPGLWGIPEPTGAVLPAEALAEADLVLASALAATRDGRRLGVGGGWYDRALLSRRKGTPVWVLLADDEVLDELPAEPHDVRVDALVTPSALLQCHA